MLFHTYLHRFVVFIILPSYFKIVHATYKLRMECQVLLYMYNVQTNKKQHYSSRLNSKCSNRITRGYTGITLVQLNDK